MLQPSEKIWMDGAFVNWGDASVHVLTHSLHYGLAAFEGIRCYKGREGSAIFRLPEHVDRLFESAHIAMMELPYDKKQITDAIVETVRINKLEACYIRPLVYVGYGAMGLYPGENPIKVAMVDRGTTCLKVKIGMKALRMAPKIGRMRTSRRCTINR